MDVLHGFERKGENLWKRGEHYFVLFANGGGEHYLVNPLFRRLSRVDVATGKNVYGYETYRLEWSGTVPKYYPYERNEGDARNA